MPQPHKHADLIKAWADGAEIEYADFQGNWALCTDYPRWDCDTRYRIKAPPLQYRVAVMKSDGFGEPNYLVLARGPHGANLLENRQDFLRWVTDWIEVEQ